jgi:hypothetical protein
MNLKDVVFIPTIGRTRLWVPFFLRITESVIVRLDGQYWAYFMPPIPR